MSGPVPSPSMKGMMGRLGRRLVSGQAASRFYNIYAHRHADRLRLPQPIQKLQREVDYEPDVVLLLRHTDARQQFRHLRMGLAGKLTQRNRPASYVGKL